MAAVTATTTASVLHAATNGMAGTKESVALKADAGNAVPIYLGVSDAKNPTVTTANGFPLEAGETIVVDLLAGQNLAGIVSAGTATGRTLVVGN